MYTQSSWGGERRGKESEHGWTCSTDIENEAMTMKAMMEKLTVNNLQKNEGKQHGASLFLPLTRF